MVRLICNLIAYEPKLAIKEEALQVAAAILLGGNAASQAEFARYITEDVHNKFMRELQFMLKNAFEKISNT